LFRKNHYGHECYGHTILNEMFLLVPP